MDFKFEPGNYFLAARRPGASLAPGGREGDAESAGTLKSACLTDPRKKLMMKD